MRFVTRLPPGWRRVGLALLYFVVGPPLIFVLLSPFLTLLGYLTELFSPRRIGDIDILIVLGGMVAVVLFGAVLAVVAAALAIAGTMIATFVAFFTHIFSRFGR